MDFIGLVECIETVQPFVGTDETKCGGVLGIEYLTESSYFPCQRVRPTVARGIQFEPVAKCHDDVPDDVVAVTRSGRRHR